MVAIFDVAGAGAVGGGGVDDGVDGGVDEGRSGVSSTGTSGASPGMRRSLESVSIVSPYMRIERPPLSTPGSSALQATTTSASTNAKSRCIPPLSEQDASRRAPAVARLGEHVGLVQRASGSGFG